MDQRTGVYYTGSSRAAGREISAYPAETAREDPPRVGLFHRTGRRFEFFAMADARLLEPVSYSQHEGDVAQVISRLDVVLIDAGAFPDTDYLLPIEGTNPL